MQRDATKFYEEWPAAVAMVKSKAPEIAKGFGAFFRDLMKDGGEGGLSVKHKELTAMAIGVAVRCEPCIYAHVEKCLKAGATPREIMDATGVAVMMGGGPAYTYLPLVAGALEHFEKNPPSAAHE